MNAKKQNYPIKLSIGIAVGWILIFLLTGCDGKAEKQPAKPAPPDVQVAEVIQGKVPIVREFSGTIKAIKTVDIIPRVSGYIDERYFEEGTFVKKGDPLYLIDPRPYKAKLDAYKAQLKLDQAGLAFWQKETKRYESLAKQGAASKEKTEGTIAKRDELLATVAKDKADIENAKLDLSFTRITAPFDGRVQETRINVGNLVQQQRDVLTTLVQLDPVYVVFNISRSHVFEIQLLKRQGKLFEIADMRIEIQLPDGSTYSQQGQVNFISFQINPATDTVLVRGIIANKKDQAVGDYDLIPGQYAPVRLILGEDPAALLIPQPALVESQIGRQVFVVNADNKVESRSVEIGRGYQGQWVIKKGLKKGEKVIVEGTQKVRPGVVVNAKPYAREKEPKQEKNYGGHHE
ncbi:MAG: efflux RND transporter periplasmic adaptor subunit [Desulfobacterales bacterium]|jgi:RND family efflux transporter MFP subunit